ncbi:MAG: GAF domain-containing protein, partial [Fibrobacter sp.]|nr:GAF domain-containing protein [Fibrobacter sp.]
MARILHNYLHKKKPQLQISVFFWVHKTVPVRITMHLQNNTTELSFNGLSVLYQIARILSTGGTLNTLMEEVLRELEAQAGMKRGMISILSPDGRELTVEVAHSIPDYFRQKGRYRVGEGITGTVAKSGKPIVVPKLKDEPLFLDRTGARRELNLGDLAFLCVPIKIG